MLDLTLDNVGEDLKVGMRMLTEPSSNKQFEDVRSRQMVMRRSAQGHTHSLDLPFAWLDHILVDHAQRSKVIELTVLVISKGDCPTIVVSHGVSQHKCYTTISEAAYMYDMSSARSDRHALDPRFF